MLRQYKLKDYNFRLILWLITLSTIGILLVGSAESSLQTKQILGVGLGVFAMVVVSFIDFSWILHFYWVIYAFNILLLLMVYILPHSAGGATRWIEIGGFTFQPVEMSKILITLFFARYLMDHENDINSPRTILKSLVLIGFPLAIIIAQPDLKNTITIAALFAILYFIAGISYKFVLTMLGLGILLVGAVLTVVVQPDQTLLKDYQRDRVMSFLYPDDDAYSDGNTQQKNSVTAIGSGELTGKGLNNSEVDSANKGNFISQIQTDFIFAVAGEELGFLGSAGIIILLLLIELECLHTSRRAKDLSGTLICCGIASIVAIQSFINIGVATRILPNTGTPLPFVSYGTTSMVSIYTGMGFVLNVGLQNKIHFQESSSKHRLIRLAD